MTEMSSFFARRRAGLRAEAEAEAEAQTNADDQVAPDEGVVEQPDLPDPDTMVSGDDFAAFMAKAVPTHLRNRALRTLWRSNPVLACVDGLNDYDDDYLAMSKNQGPIRTTYEVGRGLKRHIDALAEAREKLANPVAPPADLIDDVAETDIELVAEAPVHTAYTDAPLDVSEDESAPPAPRRMRFRNSGDA